MYTRILLPVDNSPYSDYGLEAAIHLGECFGSSLVGFHVYAARLHDQRFRQLESGLPDKYQDTAILNKQRQAHQSLIFRGLELISRSYLEACARRCAQAEVPFEAKVAEGKNFQEIVKEAGRGYDLVVLGLLGLGADGNPIGSVCQRVARRLTEVDMLVVKNQAPLGGRIMVALDGSPGSRFALGRALKLAQAWHGSVEAVAAYDPQFHNVVFQKLVGVLSEEAGRMFRFQEQEQLHQQVIDQGMAQLCRESLTQAEQEARSLGIPLSTTLLSGKPASAVAAYAKEQQTSLLVVGRYGAHRVEGLDIGSTAEALLLSAPCHLLIAADSSPKEAAPPERPAIPSQPEPIPTLVGTGQPTWTEEARQRLERVPPFVLGVVVKFVEGYARQKGARIITPELVEEAKASWERSGAFNP